MLKPRNAAIVLARMNSQRLPGKVLCELDSIPLLQHIINRCRNCDELDDIIVATTEQQEDDAIVKFCQQLSIRYFRGETNSVAHRLLACCQMHALDAFIRVNGDSPFLQPSLIDTGIKLFNKYRPDLVTNLLNRTYPYGVAVEVVKTATLRNAVNKHLSSYQQEHPTAFLYQNPDLFLIQEIPPLPANFSHLRLTVDTIDDKLAVESLLKKIRITLGNNQQTNDLNLLINLL